MTEPLLACSADNAFIHQLHYSFFTEMVILRYTIFINHETTFRSRLIRGRLGNEHDSYAAERTRI